MNFLSLILPQTVHRTFSKFSGEIKVVDHVFERRLVVGGLTQSGGITKNMWGKAFKQFPIFPANSGIPLRRDNFQFPISNVLVLGLGAGTVAQVINKKWSEAKIVGIEIDPVIIDVGKKYFHLVDVKNLAIVIEDAITFVNNGLITHNLEFFDLIVIDLYKGFLIEKNVQNERFLQKIAQKLAKNGIVIFNVITGQNDDFEAGEFLDKLHRIFEDIFCKRIISNDFFFCTNPRKTG